MSRRLAVLATGVIVVMLVAAGRLSAQQGQLPWQTSWTAFVEALGPLPGTESMRTYRQFEGRPVTWEGVARPSSDATFPVETTPSAAAGYDVILQVTPRGRELTQWKRLAVGSRIRFKGSIATVFPVAVTRVGGTSTTTTVAVFVKGAELVER